jgi:hypothetical protein
LKTSVDSWQTLELFSVARACFLLNYLRSLFSG